MFTGWNSHDHGISASHHAAHDVGSEGGPMNKKRIRASAVLPQKRVALAVAAALLPWAAQTTYAQTALAPNTLPTGGQVTAGTANISTTASKMQIDQSTDKAILNWQTFSIGSGA